MPACLRRPWRTTVGVVLLLAAWLTPVVPAGAADAQAHEFYFTRGVYSSTADGDAWGPRWAIDFPEADQHFLVALRRMTGVDAFPRDNIVPVGADAAPNISQCSTVSNIDFEPGRCTLVLL